MVSLANSKHILQGKLLPSAIITFSTNTNLCIDQHIKMRPEKYIYIPLYGLKY